MTMDGMEEKRPRLTPEEADARFAALVAEHRRGTRRTAGQEKSVGALFASKPRPLVGGYANLAMMLVYMVGVVAGAIWHAKVGVAILLGVLVFIVRWDYAKFSRPAGD